MTTYIKTFSLSTDTMTQQLNNKQSVAQYNQGDVNTDTLNLTVTHNNATMDLTGASVSVVFSKPDGKVVYQDTTNGVTITNATQGQISIALNTQTRAAAGTVIGAVRVTYSGNQTLETEKFSFNVEASLASDQAIASNNDIQALQALIKFKSFTASANQTLFDISDVGSYTTGQNRLFIDVGGAPQSPNNYTETSTTSFTLSEAVPAGTIVNCRWFQGGGAYLGGHNTTHEIGGGDVIDVTKLLNYNEQIATPLAGIATNVTLYSSIQAAADYLNTQGGGKLLFPSGTYTVSSTINLYPNIILEGVNKDTVIINSSATGFTFAYQTSNGSGENNAPQFKNLTIKCNSGIQLNSQSGGFTNDSTSQGYVMRPLIEDCIISANTVASGTGIQWSKCFDGHIQRTEVMNFQYNIDFMGSDICSIKHNRLRGAGIAQIRVQSNQTFGSQTLIQHNDLLSLQSNATAFIMSSDHYLIVKDNYIEQVSGSGINSAIQIMNGSIVAIIQNNRIEVPSTYAPNWLNVQTALLLLDIKNNTTSGSAMGDALFPTGGAAYWYNAFLRQKIIHSGNTAGGLPFNSQSTFIPSGKNAFTLTSDLPGMTSANNGVNTLVSSDGSFVIPVQANYGSMITVDPSTQFPGGVSGIVSVKIVAKADTAGQTLYWQCLNGGSVVSTTSFALTTGYVAYTLIVSTYYSNGITLKFWNNDSTHNSNVYIKKVVIDYEKAEGTATIAASGTSVVVGHNMNYTPTIINVTAQGNVGNLWITNITSTQFTINCSTAPTSATTVAWRAD